MLVVVTLTDPVVNSYSHLAVRKSYNQISEPGVYKFNSKFLFSYEDSK